MKFVNYNSTFLDMLGYKTKQLCETRLAILDKNNKEVGFVQWQKLQEETYDKPAEYGYNIVIENDTISYNEIQLESNNSMPLNVVFFEKNEKGQTTRFTLDTSKFIGLNIRKENGECVDFFVDDEKLYIEEKTNGKGYKIHETIIYNWNNKNVDSSLYIRTNYFNKELDFENMNLYSPLFSNETQILQPKYGNAEVSKTIEKNETIDHHETWYIPNMKDGMYSINFIQKLKIFKDKVNNMVPFNEDIFNILLINTDFPLKEDLFPTSYKKEVKTKTLKPKETK